MRQQNSFAMTVVCLSLWPAQAIAQGGAHAHNPISIVDTGDRLKLFGPPEYPPTVHNVGPPNHNLLSGLLNIGDGWPENFLYVEPLPPPTQLVPLVVMFHKFGSTQLDLTKNTNFPNEVGARGWYLVCPLAANTQHFGSLQSQVHMEAVILDMLARYPLIDRNRIYAVGFSMGAGAVANYAARHVDPAKPMIAAMAAMSGGFSLPDTYYSDPPARIYLDFWFGNNTVGSADAWKMARSSSVCFDPITGQVQSGTDLARNLTHIPMQIYHPVEDPLPYLMRQGDIMSAHMQTLGAVVGPDFGYQHVPFGVDSYDHKWSMMDSRWTFGWLGQHTLSLPTAARTLADHDGIYFHFFVEQDTASAFTPFDWQLDTANNALRLAATSNLKRLTVDTLAAGLDPSMPLRIDLSTADGLADQVVFTSVPAAPTQVSRDGNATVAWNYNATAQELTLIESDGLPHIWSVVP